MNKIRTSFAWLSVIALTLALIPVMSSAQDVELPITWKGEGTALVMPPDGLQKIDLKCSLNVDTDGWVTGKLTDGEHEAVIKRFYFEAAVDGAYKLIIVFVDNDENEPGMFILDGRLIGGKLLYGEVFRKAYEKEGEIEKNLYLGDNSAQEIYSDYMPQSLKKAMSVCKPVGCLAVEGNYEK